ncbi:MAG: biopolymer transporter ExbD [Paludibacteraceae bacterium]|jgi:biopolymer transport protein ExbD|nr:biopolymer transporter ExbD [Paludibacteraceae bacterium]MBP5642018.1 biopolymer transporter ExbD [Paludibacteraceae bacterium]MBQ4391086.1 biopolymer transporter ExbD [Paludibacteraceae bacterium]
MALKRRNRVEATFAMSSMTDLIFLLLLFFVMASTMSSPNDIKINLPQAKAKTTTKHVVAKVSIDNLGNYFVALGKQKPTPIAQEDLEAYLSGIQQQDSTMYIALHADQDIAYKEVVHVLDIANEHKMKLVIATKR